MKLKKLIVVCLALMMMLCSVLPVNATDDLNAVDENGDDVDISEDPVVLAAYDAYFAISEALNVHEYGPLKEAVEEYNSIIEGFTAEQSDEWDQVVAVVIGYDEALSTLISANMVVDTVAKRAAYQENPNAKTAQDFVYMYEECVKAGIEIALFEFGMEDAYAKAKSDVPFDGVLKVYDAYTDLKAALGALECGFYDEDFVNACVSFEAVLDIFNELTEDEMKDLACLMEMEDAEDAFYTILSDWINANLALELGAAYDEYLNHPTDKKVASAFVEKYEEILNDTQMLTDEDKQVILTSFEDAYEDAKAFLAEADNTPNTPNASDTPNDDKTTDTSGKFDKESIPKTGDAFNVAPVVLMVIAAAAAGLEMKRRNVQ